VWVEFLDEVACPNVGFMLRNRLGEDVFGTNMLNEGELMTAAATGERVWVDFVLDVPHLHSGFYYLSPAVADGTIDDYEHCDWIDNAFALEVIERTTTYGHIRIPVRARSRTISRGRIEVRTEE
jgi:hypothetical protein